MGKSISNSIFVKLHNLTRSLLNKNIFIGVLLGKTIQFLTKNNYKIVKRGYLNNIPSRTSIKKESISYIIEPTEINSTEKKVKKELASLGYNIIKNGIVDGHSPFIMINDRLYKQKYFTCHSEKKVEYKTRLVLQTTPKYAYIDCQKSFEHHEKGIFMGGSWPFNWYHWVIEIIAKIEVLQFLPAQYHNYPILVPDVINSLKNHKYLLEKLFSNNEVIYLNEYRWHQVNEVIWLDSIIIDSPYLKKIPNKINRIDINVHWDLIKNFQERVVASISQKKSFSKRIFLARNQEKRTYNQSEVYEMLKKYDFEAIYLENLTIEEQQTAIYNADFILGPTGAAWTNLIFCSANTKLLVWMPEVVKNVSVFANLAHLTNNTLIHYYFPCNTKSWIEFMHQEETTIIDVIELEAIVKKMIN